MDDLVKRLNVCALSPDNDICAEAATRLTELEAEVKYHRFNTSRQHRLYNAIEEAIENNDFSAAIAIIAQARSPSSEALDKMKSDAARVSSLCEVADQLYRVVADIFIGEYDFATHCRMAREAIETYRRLR